VKSPAPAGREFQRPRGQVMPRMTDLDGAQKRAGIHEQRSFLRQIGVYAFPAHGAVGENRQVRIVPVGTGFRQFQNQPSSVRPAEAAFAFNAAT